MPSVLPFLGQARDSACTAVEAPCHNPVGVMHCCFNNAGMLGVGKDGIPTMLQSRYRKMKGHGGFWASSWLVSDLMHDNMRQKQCGHILAQQNPGDVLSYTMT